MRSPQHVEVLDAETTRSIEAIRSALLEWFGRHARDFLWRRAGADEYVLVVSEVLLQRTQARTVNDFLPGFLQRYPTWIRLARARR